MKKRKKTEKVYKVYITYYADKCYYIGFTSKSDRALQGYFGSNKTDKKIVNKKIIYTSTSKTNAKLWELILQLKNIDDPKCINDMLNIRLRRSHTTAELPYFKIKTK